MILLLALLLVGSVDAADLCSIDHYLNASIDGDLTINPRTNLPPTIIQSFSGAKMIMKKQIIGHQTRKINLPLNWTRTTITVMVSDCAEFPGIVFKSERYDPWEYSLLSPKKNILPYLFALPAILCLILIWRR